MVKVRNRSLLVLLLVAAALLPPALAQSPGEVWQAQVEVDNPDTVDNPDAGEPPTAEEGEAPVDPAADTATEEPPALAPTFEQPEQLPAGTELTIEGSPSMAVITQRLVQQFQQTYPNATVTLTAESSDTAIANLLAGTVDLAAIGRALTEEEQANGLTAIAVSREKIAVIVGANNPYMGQLEAADFVRIFRGEITNWSELGGPDLPIRFIDRPPISDTRAALGNYELFGGDLTAGEGTVTVANDSTPEVVEALGDNGISYAIASQVIGQDNVRVLSMHSTLPDDPRYPYSQPRSYLYRSTETLPIEVEAFLATATNAQGQATIAQAKAAEAADVAAADLPDRLSAVRPNGQGFVTGDRPGNLNFWNADGTSAGSPVPAHTGPVTALAFSADGQRLISGGADGTIRLWDAIGTPVGDPINGGNGPITSLVVKPDGSFISANADGTLQPWDATGQPVGAPITGHTAAVREMALTADGATLITAAKDGTLRRWNAADGTPLGEPLGGHQGAVQALALKPDGTFFSGGADGTVRRWGADGAPVGEPLAVAGPVTAIASNAEGTSIAVGDDTGALQYLSGEGVPVGAAITDIDAPIDDLAFTPDGQRLIVSAGDTPQLRDSTGQVIPIPNRGEDADPTTPVSLPPAVADLWQRLQQLPPQVLWMIPVAVLGLLLLGLLRSFRQDEEDTPEDEAIAVLPEASAPPTGDDFTADDFPAADLTSFTTEAGASPLDASLAQAKQTLTDGVGLGNAGRYQEALDRFNKAIELADLERLKAAAAGVTLTGAAAVIARGLARRGTALANLGRPQEALQSLNRSLEMEPNDLAAWIGKGNVLAQLGQLDEALFCFDKAIELNPTIAAAWQGKGRALQRMGREVEGRNAIAKADALGGVNQDIPIELGTPVTSPSRGGEGEFPAGSARLPITPGPEVSPPGRLPVTPDPTPVPSGEPDAFAAAQPPLQPVGPIGIMPPPPPPPLREEELPPDLLAAIDRLPLETAPPPPSPGSMRPTGPVDAPPDTAAIAPGSTPDVPLPADVEQTLAYLPTEAEAPDPQAPMVAPIAVPPEVDAILAGESDIPGAPATPAAEVADPMAALGSDGATVAMRPPARSPAPRDTARVPDQPNEADDPALAGLPPEVLEALKGIPADSPDSFQVPPSAPPAAPPPPPTNPRLQ